MRPCPCGTMGDVNLDGGVDVKDGLFLVQYLGGVRELSAEQLANADVDGDGKVTENDSHLIAQYIAGIIDTFPVCKTNYTPLIFFGGLTLLVVALIISKRK